MPLRFRLQRIVPSLYEIVGLLFLAIALLIVGNSQALLKYYGLNSSQQVIQQSTHTILSHGLGKIDSFSATDRVVTFAIWAFVGILCFSIVQAIGGMYHQFKEDEALSSNQYVHPSTFTRGKFWRSVFFDFSTLVLGLVALGLLVYGFFGFVVPTALDFSRQLMSGIGLESIEKLLLAGVIVYVWLLLIDVCLRLVGNRHRILS